jgi:hypothetical protein
MRQQQSTSQAYQKGTPILLTNSPDQNPCGKSCSQHSAKIDENRTSALTNTTIIQSIGCACRLVVISPTVSELLLDS